MRISDHKLYFKNVPKDLTKAQYYELMCTFSCDMSFDEMYRKWYACFRYILKSYKLGFTTKAIDSLFHDFDMCNWHFASEHVDEPKDKLLKHFCGDALYISDRTSYDCSYVDDHPERWEADDNVGNSMSISQYEYEMAKSLWANNTFVDMNRDYHSIDGDAYTTSMPDSANTPLSPRVLGYSREGSYRNKIVFSKSIFKFKDVSHDEDSVYGLYNWSGSSLMGINNSIASNLLDNANYLYGYQDQISLRMLVFKNKPQTAGFLQESKWNGGNKNEFNVCVGINDANTIQWVKVISWTANEILKLEVRDSIYAMKQFDAVNVAKYMVTYVPKKFIRREFKEFEYLPTPESPWLYLMGIGIVLVFGIIAFFVRID